MIAVIRSTPPTSRKETPCLVATSPAASAQARRRRAGGVVTRRSRCVQQRHRRRQRGRQDHDHALDAEPGRQDRRPGHLGDRRGVRGRQSRTSTSRSAARRSQSTSRASRSRRRATRCPTCSGSTRPRPRRCSKRQADGPQADPRRPRASPQQLPESTVSNFTADDKIYGVPYQGLLTGLWVQQEDPRRQRPRDADHVRRPRERRRRRSTSKGIMTISNGANQSSFSVLVVPASGSTASATRTRSTASSTGPRATTTPTSCGCTSTSPSCATRAPSPPTSPRRRTSRPSTSTSQGKAAMLDAGVWASSAIQDSAVAADTSFWNGPTFDDGVGEQNIVMNVASAPAGRRPQGRGRQGQARRGARSSSSSTTATRPSSSWSTTGSRRSPTTSRRSTRRSRACSRRRSTSRTRTRR